MSRSGTTPDSAAIKETEEEEQEVEVQERTSCIPIILNLCFSYRRCGGGCGEGRSAFREQRQRQE